MRTKKVVYFNHPHPLRESEVQEEDGIVCSACELDLSGSAYKCNTSGCKFFLHKACFELPQEIQHKSHPAHPLTLLSSPAAGGYGFTCNACGEYGSAFTYHCSTCDYDLHIKCASLPETVNREDHQHPITLCYSVIYDDEETQLVCDVCEGTIDGCWVYCCLDCDFGTHLNCATTKAEEEEEEEKEEEKEEKEEEEEEEEKQESSGSTDQTVANMNALLAAQIKAQGDMQRLQFQMQASNRQAQFMQSLSRSMANL